MVLTFGEATCARMSRLRARTGAEHSPGRRRAHPRSYLQVVFRAEHVRVPDADAAEGHGEEDRGLRLLPAVLADLQGHPGRRTQREAGAAGCDSHGGSVAREAGGDHAQALPGQAEPRRPEFPAWPGRAPATPAHSPCGCVGVRAGSLGRFLGSYSFPEVRAKLRRLGPTPA